MDDIETRPAGRNLVGEARSRLGDGDGIRRAWTAQPQPLPGQRIGSERWIERPDRADVVPVAPRETEKGIAPLNPVPEVPRGDAPNRCGNQQNCPRPDEVCVADVIGPSKRAD